MEEKGHKGATLLAMEQSLSSWEKNANERFNDWQNAAEIKPLFRTARNYGTFARRDFLYSGSACAPPSAASRQDATSSSSLKRTKSGRSDSGSRSSEEGTADAQAGAFLEHILFPGDTLSALAVKYRVQVNDITRANGISSMGSHTSLLVRKSLRIPVSTHGASAVAETAAGENAAGEDDAGLRGGDICKEDAAQPVEASKAQSCKHEAKLCKEERRAARAEEAKTQSESSDCFQSNHFQLGTARRSSMNTDVAARLAAVEAHTHACAHTRTNALKHSHTRTHAEAASPDS